MSRTWVRLGANVTANAKAITLAEPILGWKSAA
jgi:hypothetical protein